MYDIKQLFLFKGMRDNSIEDLLKRLPEPVRFKKGEVIYGTNSYEHAIGVFIEGCAAAMSGGVIKRRFCEGDVFGAAAVFGSEGSYISEIRAKSECTVQLISEEHLKIIFGANPDAALNYITFLSDKIRFLNHRITQFTCKGAPARLLRFLRENMSCEGVVNTVNMTELAHMAGMGRTSLYRALDELEEGGLISRKNNIIKVE